jgi:hypothetical protein
MKTNLFAEIVTAVGELTVMVGANVLAAVSLPGSLRVHP